jgi:hypothetical protein
MPRLFIGNREVTPAIVKSSIINNQDKTITENGVYTADEGYTGLGEVTVEVSPEITELNVTPTTSAQVIVAPAGTDGYSPVNVAAVTSSIDANIIAGNIKSGVSILGVTGNVVELNGETKVITPTTSQQIITPSSGKNAITQATVEAVTSSIDSNIIAGNIKKDVTILGVTGTVEEGITPTGTINITENGTIDVTNYASAEVNVQSSVIGIPREITSQGIYSMPLSSDFIFKLPDSVTTIGSYSLAYAFHSCNKLVSVNFNNVTSVSTNGLSYAFYGCLNLSSVTGLNNITSVTTVSAFSNAFIHCSQLASVDFSGLSLLSGTNCFWGIFQNCINLTSIDLSSLTTISGDYAMTYAFAGCSNLSSLDLSSVTTIDRRYAMQYTFENCTGLTSVDLSNLTTISGNYAMQYAFYNCTSLTSLSFPALTSTSFGSYTNQFNSMHSRVTGCAVHFPSNLQSVIGSWSDVTAGFGGTNTIVLFDLPATT